MSSLAIVIAVSDYGGAPNDLSACAQDGNALKEILESSNRFNSVLFINENTTGTAVKTRISDFIKTFHKHYIDEVLFYFTGHGEFASSANEFYYLLSDYNPRHRRTTSLENAEVDDLIRPLNPQLFVKIVDACNSGKTYIKSRDEIDEYLKSANSKFKNLYFLFSSQADQYSSASEKISYFTESILKSVHSHTAETIRYKDVISYVSDDFSANRAQTPLFVTQADFTETFLPVNAEIKTIIERYIDTGAPDDEPDEAKQVKPKEEVPALKLADKIKENAKIFCSREEAVDILTKLPPLFDRDFLSEDVAGLFTREVQTLETKPFADRQIGSWIDQNKDTSNYFAAPTKSEETYKKRVSHPLLGITAAFRGDGSGDTYVDAKRTVVDGYRLTTDMPYTHSVLRLKSDLPNVDMEACFVAPIISRTRIRLFWAYTHYKYADWDKQVLASTIEWNTDEALLKDQAKIEALAAKILDGFKGFVEESLRAAWEG